MNFTENTIFTIETRTVAELVRAAQAGDRDAFGELFERYRSGIVALAMRRVRNADEAEELAQDVFIQAMQKIDQLRVPEAFGGWLRRIVHRMAINRMTRTSNGTGLRSGNVGSNLLGGGNARRVRRGSRTSGRDSRQHRSTWSARPANAAGVLPAEQVVDRNEQRVRRSGRNDQASIARRP